MNLQALQALLSELVQAVTLVMQSGEQLSDEFQALLAQTLQMLFSRIEESLSQGAPPTPGPTAAPPPEGMASSNVAGAAYDNRTGDLKVQYLGKHPNRQGPVYNYPNTPPEIAQLMLSGAVPARTNGQNKWGKWWKGKAPSAGASAYTLLKNRNAPYQRMS